MNTIACLEEKISSVERQNNLQNNQLRISNENFSQYKRDSESNLRLLNQRFQEVKIYFFFKINQNHFCINDLFAIFIYVISF